MIDSSENSAELLDLLLDLKHDLGKYLQLPVAMLPPDAGPQALREALEDALSRTRRRGDRVQGAAEIWENFRCELAPWGDAPWYGRIEGAVEAALALRDASSGERGRQEILRVLGGVSREIDFVLDMWRPHE